MLTNDTIPISWRDLTIPTLLPQIGICQQYCALVRGHNCKDLSADSYRSVALAEVAQRVLPQSCHTPFSADMTETFSRYVERKALLLRENKWTKDISIVIGPLSLLLLNWRDSLFDGACTPETYGYIDDDCIPGWDTWVTIVSLEKQQHALLCWVPADLCREVDSAIALDAANCMSWLTFDRHSNKPFLVGWGKRWEPMGCR
jgi:hypothetical protein